MRRRQFLSLAAASAAAVPAFADGPFTEPVYREKAGKGVAVRTASRNPAPAPRNTNLSATRESAKHPLDVALDIARAALESSRANINDYTALLIKREQTDGTLGQHEYMSLKVRNRKTVNGQVTQPFSVYLGFLKPSDVKGRECLYVEGKNGGNLTAHEGGFKGRFLPTVDIAPTGMLAMRGQRYPITDVGLENLLVKLIERGGRARKVPGVQCEFRKGARVRDRVCTVIQVTQPSGGPGREFHQAQIFLDDELNVPIRYVAYDFPPAGQKVGPILEEYTYLSLRLNVGLTDQDFDRNNAKYNFN